MKTAIIRFDPERVRFWDAQAEGLQITFALKRALSGATFDTERGIVSVDLIPDDAELIVAPPLTSD